MTPARDLLTGDSILVDGRWHRVTAAIVGTSTVWVRTDRGATLHLDLDEQVTT